MKISQTENCENNHVVIEISGKIDIGHNDQFVKKIQDSFFSGKNFVILDLSNVVFISSVGLAAVLEAKNFMESRGGKLFIVGLGQKWQKVFELITGNKMHNFYESINDALIEYKEHVYHHPEAVFS